MRPASTEMRRAGTGRPWRPISSGVTIHAAKHLLQTGLSYYAMRNHPDLVRDTRGAYRRGEAPTTAEETYANLLEGRYPQLRVADGVLSHTTAALLHGLCVPWRALHRIEITRTADHWPHTSRHVRVHTGDVDGQDLVLLDGYPVTSLARTVMDVARTWPHTWAVAAGDMALRAGLERAQLDEMLERLGAVRGCLDARWVVGRLNAGAESPGESISRVMILEAGLPEPTVQAAFRVHGRDYRTDLLIEANGGVVGEFDGAGKYRRHASDDDPATAVLKEKLREDELRQVVHGFVRWGWPELREPDGFIGRLAHLAGVRPRRLGPRPDF